MAASHSSWCCAATRGSARCCCATRHSNDLQNDRLTLLIAAGLLTTTGVLAKLPGIAVVVPMTYATFAILQRRGRLGLGRLLASLPVALAAGALILGYYWWAHYLGTNYPPYHVAGSGYLWRDGLSRFLDEAFYIPATWKIASNWLFTLPVVVLTGIALLTAPPAASDAETKAGPRRAPWFFHVWLLGAAIVYVLAAREIKTNPWNFHIFNVAVAALAGSGLSCWSALAANAGSSRVRCGLRRSPPSSSSAAASPASR